MLLTDVTATSRAHAEPSNRPAVLTVFARGKEGRSPKPNCRQTKQTDDRLLASTARSLARFEQIACQSLELPTWHSSMVTGSRNSTCLMLENSSGQELTLPKATVLEVEEEASEPLIDRINARSENSANEPTKSRSKRNNKVRYDNRQEYSLDRENTLREQADDAFCSRQYPGTYRSKSEVFSDEDGLMCKRSSKGNHQLVVPATLTPKVVRQNHDPVYGLLPTPALRRTMTSSL